MALAVACLSQALVNLHHPVRVCSDVMNLYMGRPPTKTEGHSRYSRYDANETFVHPRYDIGQWLELAVAASPHRGQLAERRTSSGPVRAAGKLWQPKLLFPVT